MTAGQLYSLVPGPGLPKIFRSPFGPLAFFTNSKIFQFTAGKNGFHFHFAAAGAVKFFRRGPCPRVFTYLCHYVLLVKIVVIVNISRNVLSFLISVNIFAAHLFRVPGVVLFAKTETLNGNFHRFSVRIDDSNYPCQNIDVLDFTLFPLKKDLRPFGREVFLCCFVLIVLIRQTAEQPAAGSGNFH